MNTPDYTSLDLAKRAVATIGQVPTSFTTVTRLLCADYREGYDSFSKKSEFEVSRILKVSTVTALLYFAAETYFPKKIEERDLRGLDLAKLFDPLTLAAIFSLSYLYKRCQRICPPEEWKRLGAHVNKWVEIAGLVGENVSGVGLGIGIIGGAMPLLGNLPYIVHDMKGFQEHRRIQGGYKLLGDSSAERTRFGCSSLEIGGSMLQIMGFGPEFASGFEQGLSSHPLAQKTELHERFRILATWVRGLETEVRQPPELKKESEKMETGVLPLVLGRVSDIVSQSAESRWLDRTREDLTPEKAPFLHL